MIVVMTNPWLRTHPLRSTNILIVIICATISVFKDKLVLIVEVNFRILLFLIISTGKSYFLALSLQELLLFGPFWNDPTVLKKLVQAITAHHPHYPA